MSGGKSDILEAKSINAGACDFCDAVHINLLDAGGDVFATASLPASSGEHFIGRIRECMAEIARRGCPSPARRQ
jgi:hypothetical protein